MNIEFIVAVILLTFVVISTVMFAIRLMPSFGDSFGESNLRAKATALENLLLYKPGVPANWTQVPVAVIGLAAFNNYSNATIAGALDLNKIVQLNTSPYLNYSNLRKNLSLDVDFYLKINSTDGIMEYFNYTPAKTDRVISINKVMVLTNSTLNRINKTEANITLLVW